VALLCYEKLDVRFPRLPLQNGFWGLRDFLEYLRRTIEHLEDESLLRLAWHAAPAPRPSATSSASATAGLQPQGATQRLIFAASWGHPICSSMGPPAQGA
jgi:hypothetical protein